MTTEQIQDMLNTFLVAGSGLSKSYDDASNNLTLGLAGESFTSAEKSKLSGIESGAEVNLTGSELVTELNTTLNSTAWQNPLTQEQVQDFMSTALTGGNQTNISVTYDDATNTFDFFVTASGGSGGGLTEEEIEDLVAGFIINGAGISKVYDDATGQLTISLSNEIYTTGEKSILAGIESGATADQTPAEIRAAVEAATDSNVFTDADHTKLNGIEALATADQDSDEVPYDNADSNLSATDVKSALDELDSNKVGITITGRTGSDINYIMTQTQSEYDTDGATSPGEVVFITDAAPADDFTGTVIPLDGYYQHDDTATDTATWTLDASPKNGAVTEILINLASEPTVTGATKIAGTADFSPNTLSLLTVKHVLGTTYYYFTNLA